MNILLVVQNYYPFVGGIETHARQVAQEFGQQHKVQVIAGNFAPCRLRRRLGVLHTNLLAPSYANYQDNGVPVHALTPRLSDRARMLPIAARALPYIQRPTYHRLHCFGYLWYRRAYLPRMRRLAQQADVVHAMAGDYIAWTAQEAAQHKGIPFVCTPFVHPHQWGDGPEDIAFYRKADAVIGLVQTDRDYLASLGISESKLHVIGVSPDLPPAADPEGFRQRHQVLNTPLILFVGRMTAHKGAKGVIEASARVWETIPDARFVFIGPSSPTETVLPVDLDPRILYLGKVSAQEKADALAACDVFCMPSTSEILPTVYLEAWSYGKPVLGGRAHGLPELLEDNRAGIAVSQDPAEIAMRLCKLLGDAELRARLGQNGRDLVAERYSVRAVTGALTDLYQQEIAAKQTREKRNAVMA